MYQKLCTEFYDNDKPFADKQEVNFYSQFFTKDQLILEPMCGTGRLLIPMIAAGFNVHGVDNSPYMLENCRKRLKAKNLNTEIIEASVTDMKLPRQYDGIIIPFGSFQLLYPRAIAYETLNQLHQHLKPKGKLIMDLFIPWDALYPGGEEQTGKKQTILPDGDIITIKSHGHANKIEQWILSQDTYEKKSDGKVIAVEEETMHLCWYFIYEFELILEKHGFTNITRLSKIVNSEELTVYVGEKL